MSKTLEYRVRVPPSEVLSRVASSIDDGRRAFTMSGYAGDKAFIGQVYDTSFRIRKKRWYRNGFEPNLYGLVQEADGWTIVRAQVRMEPLVRYLLAVWVSTFLALSIWYGASALGGDPDAATGVRICLSATAVGAAAVGVGRLLGLPEERALKALLKELCGNVRTGDTEGRVGGRGRKRGRRR